MELSETRKADRAKMVKALAAIVEECGATCTVTAEGSDRYSPKRAVVTVEAAQGLACYFDFDGGSSQPNVFVNPWHMSYGFEGRMSKAFPGDVNPFHRRKCTTVAYGFDELCAHVREVLTLAKSGEAFEA
jgi:hypothetical protein